MINKYKIFSRQNFIGIIKILIFNYKNKILIVSAQLKAVETNFLF